MRAGLTDPSGSGPRQVVARNNKAPTLAELKMQIAKRELVLPARLETVARVMFSEPDYVAIENSASIARRCNVPATTLSRLAPRLGFRSFKEMQTCFRNHILDRQAQRKPS
jgi:DNA-binding MurR/RpiR family transcriptional regulator